MALTFRRCTPSDAFNRALVHLTFSDDDFSSSCRTLCRAIVDISLAYKPRASAVRKVTCGSCRVAWDAWLESGQAGKPLTLRRWSGLAFAQAVRPPKAPEHRQVNRHVEVDGHMVWTTAPANAPEEVWRERAIQAHAAAVLQEEQEQEHKARAAEQAHVDERAARLEHARVRARVLATRVKSLTTRLKKWQRRVKRLERAT